MDLFISQLNLLVGTISTMYYKHSALSKQDTDKLIEESSKDKLKKTVATLAYFQLKARDGTHSFFLGTATEAERDGWTLLLSHYNKLKKTPSSASLTNGSLLTV